MSEDHILLWIIVGSASGLVLGLAGTGGGVISIPLLMEFGNYDIKEASAYGLLSLTIGAALSWFIQRKNTVYSITAVLTFFAAIIAFITAPLKALSPHWVVNILLNLTCLFSLYNLWTLGKPGMPKKERPLSYQLKMAGIGGAFTGFLSTMTGLGGGVVIIPWLTGIAHIRLEQAMACSLLTIALTAPVSAWKQGKVDLALGEWAALVGGIFITSLLVKKFVTYISPLRLVLVRKLALTSIIFIIILRTLPHLFLGKISD